MNRRFKEVACAALISAVLFHAQGPAQQAAQSPDSPLSFRGRADAVVVTAAVERNGRPLTGLRAEDFVLLDNGVRQTIANISFESLPIDVTVLFDISASVTGQVVADLQRAVAALRADLAPADRVRLVTFNMRIRRQTDFDATAQAIDQHFASIRPAGSSAVFDAIASALAAPAAPDRRQLVVLFSDGQDSSSITDASELFDIVRRTTPTLAVALALPPVSLTGNLGGSGPIRMSSGIPGIPNGPPIALMGNIATPRLDIERRALLSTLAGESGGSFVQVGAGLNAPAAFRRILTEFRASYVLNFIPTDVESGGIHTLDVRVNRDGVTVRARKEYAW